MIRLDRTKQTRPANYPALIIPVLALFLLTACGSIPERELNNFTAAVNTAQTAGVEMTEDWTAARAESSRRKAAKNAGAAQLSPAFSLQATWTPSSSNATVLTAEKVRILAWETIVEYASILAALNAGESIEKVRATTGRLLNIVDKFTSVASASVPGAKAFIDLFKELAGQLEKARLTAEFKKAIKGGASIVRKISRVLQNDTRDHFTLRWTLSEADYNRVDLIPSKVMSDADKRAKKLRQKEEHEDFIKSLDAYVILLSDIDKSLRALEVAVDKPIDLVSQTNQILDAAASLKLHWSAYRNARAEAKF